MKIRKRKRRAPIIPINSMSDIAFLLLIFIMLLSLINYRKEIKIAYPEADYVEVTQHEKNLEIWVDENGETYYKGMLISLEAIEGVIADAFTENPSVRIHVIADKNTKYKHVDDVIGILKLLQHRVVSLVVKEKK